MAAVIDEWGAFEGIVTVEDIIEVVLGDLRDDFDVPESEPSISKRENGTYVADGSLTISMVNETLDTEFETNEFGTVGGLVLDRLGRAPAVGNRIEVDGYRFTVESVDGARITSVAIDETDTSTEEGEASEESRSDDENDEASD
jgi:CBS domain containing-hemolysin-like protein